MKISELNSIIINTPTFIFHRSSYPKRKKPKSSSLDWIFTRFPLWTKCRREWSLHLVWTLIQNEKFKFVSKKKKSVYNQHCNDDSNIDQPDLSPAHFGSWNINEFHEVPRHWPAKVNAKLRIHEKSARGSVDYGRANICTSRCERTRIPNRMYLG